MIKGIYNSGRYVQVSNGSPTTPNVYSYNNNAYGNGPQSFTGQVRYNTTNQCLEIFDGSNWVQWQTSIPSVGLSPDAERILDWAQQKMLEERELKDRMEKHPGLRDAWERFQIMDALTKEEERSEHGEVQASP